MCVCLQCTKMVILPRHLRYAGVCACLRTSVSPFPSPLYLGTGPPRKTVRGKRKHRLHRLMSVKLRYISWCYSAGAVCSGVGTTLSTYSRCLREMYNAGRLSKHLVCVCAGVGAGAGVWGFLYYSSIVQHTDLIAIAWRTNNTQRGTESVLSQ